jgi:transcription elongation factor Elf1
MARPQDHQIVFQCPQCLHQMRQSLGWLRKNNIITCPACTTNLRRDPDKLVQIVETSERTVDLRVRAIRIEP